MNLLQIFMGATLLLAGRRLFWLAVGIMGFLFGFNWMSYHLMSWPAWSAWLIAAGLGLLCALGAIFLQRVSFGIMGFLAGGYLLVKLLLVLEVQSDPAPVLLFLLGGVIGAVLALVSVDWVLLTLTSLVGAAVISEDISVGPWLSGLLFLGLTLIGIAVQSASLRNKDERIPAPSRHR
ncbi:DUF4203 domain-containing protein [Geopsychrobacter electrodiphilus]|uniref:TM7S3/TM198-like domain-containing protein n=1 Tax=Geopsychrobacter electrodiphilus TaxID=225196 RepID=UPI00036F3296|nr:DUF4203 domain-containing protein [Geopsychrobacter electrodiphilus]